MPPDATTWGSQSVSAPWWAVPEAVGTSLMCSPGLVGTASTSAERPCTGQPAAAQGTSRGPVGSRGRDHARPGAGIGGGAPAPRRSRLRPDARPAGDPLGAGDEAPSGAQPQPAGAPTTWEGGTARINFRLPEQLKVQIEEAARQEGLSVNTWLVRAVAATSEPGARRVARPDSPGRRRYTGWVG
ncbi:hypothetical protein ACTWPT_30040 [Nonomuraea sp. 3N208]|uniref:hypothetical protein n=1 Tax=Nonomuraea sp. 3N208 TaxID=3457421 RepID=UPI003FD41D93